MNLAAFRDLCRRQWENGRGDVQVLHLTDDSLRELSDDLIAARRFDETWLPLLGLRIHEEDDGTRGAVITSILNPLTKSAVRLQGGARRDTAGVFRLYDVVGVPCNPGPVSPPPRHPDAAASQ